MKYFIYSVITIVAASVIAGLFIVGSPQEERLRRFDEERMNDLQMLQSAIINYYLAKDTLPAALADAGVNIMVPTDPETHASYSYTAKNKSTFALCATFALPSTAGRGVAQAPAPKSMTGPLEVTSWDHGAGYTCFEKAIDKDFYKTSRP